jgi:ankyrin repeat protein
LWQSAAQGRRELAEILLDHGANPNAQVDSSGSAVYAAFSHKQWEMVELLRSRGGLVSAATAALYRRADLAQQMLADYARGALDAGVATEKPLVEELLHFGADGGATEIVRMALERIDWVRNDPRWFGPLANPLCFWHHIPWLYAGNKDFDRPSYFNCFRLVLDRADPNLTGPFSRTVLHETAATRDHITDEEAAEFARALLEAGARTDVRDEILRSTPLGWACRWGRASVVAALLEHGADPVEADAEPWARPAAWASKMGHGRIVEMLRQRGGL